MASRGPPRACTPCPAPPWAPASPRQHVHDLLKGNGAGLGLGHHHSERGQAVGRRSLFCHCRCRGCCCCCAWRPSVRQWPGPAPHCSPRAAPEPRGQAAQRLQQIQQEQQQQLHGSRAQGGAMASFIGNVRRSRRHAAHVASSLCKPCGCTLDRCRALPQHTSTTIGRSMLVVQGPAGIGCNAATHERNNRRPLSTGSPARPRPSSS